MIMLMFIIHEYFQDWILLISFLYPVLILNCAVKSHSQIAKNGNMYMFLFIEYLNCVQFDEAFALLYRFKKSYSKNTEKAIHISSRTGINKAITCENDCLLCVCLSLALVV